MILPSATINPAINLSMIDPYTTSSMFSGNRPVPNHACFVYNDEFTIDFLNRTLQCYIVWN
jgi:hypothetical protein